MSKLTLISEAGRNKHGQRLVLVQCDCGSQPYICREDSFKQGRTKSCGCLRSGKAKRVTAPVTEPIIAPDIESDLAYGTPAYLADRIATSEAAALSCEKRARDLALEISTQTTTNLDALKKLKAEATTAAALRAEILRLQTAKSKAETSIVKDTRTQEQIVKEKIDALKPKL